MATLWTSTLEIHADRTVTLDTVLGRDIQPSYFSPAISRLMLAVTNSRPAATALSRYAVPAAVQGLVMAPSLYEHFATDLWVCIAGDVVLEAVRDNLFS